MKKTILAFGTMVASGLAIVGTPGDAHASGAGYVCDAVFIPKVSGSSLTGTYGQINAFYTTLPACNGSVLDFITYCSTGATGTATCDSSNLYTDVELQALLNRLSYAAERGQEVNEIILASGKAGPVYFYGYH